MKFPGKKRYEGVPFNAISVTRGWVSVKCSGKKRYITLEWPLHDAVYIYNIPEILPLPRYAPLQSCSGAGFACVLPQGSSGGRLEQKLRSRFKRSW